MGFKGYVYKFKLNAAHSMNSQNMLYAHDHTFEITLFIQSSKTQFMRYEELEKEVQAYLSLYENRLLNEMEPFNIILPTIENLGNIWYEQLKKRLKPFGEELIRLEIAETPSRVYTIQSQNNYLKHIFIQQMIKEASLELLQPMKDKKVKAKVETATQITTEVAVRSENLFPSVASIKPLEKEIVQREERVKPVSRLKVLLSLACLSLMALGLLFYVEQSSLYPFGADIYGHLFKSNLLYKSLKEGVIFPLYTEAWYNGVQPFRYWAPLPYYLLALCQFLAQGSVEGSYILYVGMAFFVGGAGWLLWGIRERKIGLAFVLAVLWFFLPDNVRVFFSEGNIPRMTITMLLPYLFYFVTSFVEYEKKKAIFPLLFLMILMILCHLMIAAMVGIATFIVLFLYAVLNKSFLRPIQTIIGMLLMFLLSGIWIYPALKGGPLAIDSAATSEVMKSLSSPFQISLNPLLRLGPINHIGYFYFGLSVVVIAGIGVALAGKKSLPGFISVILIFLGTTTAFIPILIKLPLNQLLWMMRFTPIAYAFLCWSLLYWKSCRRFFRIGMVSVLLVDGILSFNLPKYFEDMPVKITETLQLAKSITIQRMAILDTSLFGSYPSYFVCNDEKATDYAYGWAWQGAATAENIVQINTAVEKGHYLYAFDRLLDLGCDTVVIRKETVEKASKAFEEVAKAAQTVGYIFYKETSEAYLFHLEVEGQFGIINHYQALGIGVAARNIALLYPSFRIGKSNNLEDYSLEELATYKVLYLSGFTYNQRDKAEKMLLQLAQQGVKIIVDMNRLPVDAVTNRMKFLGVDVQPITFFNKFPSIFVGDKRYEGSGFKEEYARWNTVYLENLTHEEGFAWVNGNKLGVIGTKEDDHILFIGFNLLFSALENKDKVLLELLEPIVGISRQEVPKREIVPLKVTTRQNEIIIEATKGPVNTTLAYLDTYQSDKILSHNENLLYVEEGRTIIQVRYPYLAIGSIFSLLGLLSSFAWVKWVYRKGEDENEKKSKRSKLLSSHANTLANELVCRK